MMLNKKLRISYIDLNFLNAGVFLQGSVSENHLILFWHLLLVESVYSIHMPRRSSGDSFFLEKHLQGKFWRKVYQLRESSRLNNIYILKVEPVRRQGVQLVKIYVPLQQLPISH